MREDPPQSSPPLPPYRPPYPLRSYLARIAWGAVAWTLWPIGFARLFSLRPALLRLFGARVAGPSLIAASAQVEMPWLLSMGPEVCLGPRVRVYNIGGVELGQHVVISQDAYLCGGTHDYTDLSYPLIRKPIVIRDHAWIAAGAFIGPGVTIGEGAVVGARAVVTKDVEPWTVVAGNPARVIRRRELKLPAAPTNAEDSG